MNRFLAALALVGLATVPAEAQIGASPNLSRGFEPGKAYAVGEIDSVNLFNGNLSVQVPIGQRYPVSEKLSWGFTLVYNSKLWDFEEVFDGGSGTVYTRAVPATDFNAGFGWRMSPGELELGNAAQHQVVYIAPDGARRVFGETLHPDIPATPGYLYTADGTYLRYHESSRTIEFPDGTIHRFNGEGKLAAMHDRYWVDLNANGIPQFGEPGGWVRVTIATTSWLFTDVYNRNATVTLSNGVITSVTLPGLGGANETWSLVQSGATSIGRVCEHNADSSPASVRFLQSVSSPGSLAVYQMSEYNQPAAGSCNDTSGVLRKLTVPTQGTLEWDYGYYRRPDGSGGGEFCRAAFANSVGVTARRKVQPAAWGPSETQIYTAELEGAALPCVAGEPNTNVKEARTRVKQVTGTGSPPPGPETIHYFSVAILDEPNSWQAAELGLPFSRLQPDGAGRFLSRKVVPQGSTIALQESYVHYQTDGSSGVTFGTNPRVQSERTLWPIQNPNPDSPPATYADVDRTDFDGLGHYRTETTGGNFDSGNVRSTTTKWNPNRGTYPGSFVLPGVGEPWVLEAYTETSVTEGADTDKSVYCFDTDKGLLLRQRILAGTALGAGDLISALTRNTLGQVVQASEYGGDLQAVGTNSAIDLCDLALPAAPLFRTDYAYAAGVLATAEAKSGSGTSIGFQNVNRAIDPSTGLVLSETDPTGIVTSYGYDALHRRITSVPPANEDAWVSNVYVAATASSKARLSIVAKTHPIPQATLTKEDFYFDGFGRLVEERRLLPSSVTTKRFTSYDSSGNLLTQSVWSTAAAPAVTRFEQYDALGRPGRRVLPDGKTEFLFYDGVKARSRQYKVGTTWNASSGQVVEADVGAGEIFDRQGRLWKVREPKLTSVTGQETTEYAYDAAGRLVRVDQGSQVRTFTYDGRGFLLSESHPELGATGGGSVAYSRYDARGNLGRRVDGPWTLETIFDSFGRPTKVEEVLPDSARRIWKEWTYGTGQVSGNRSAGKVVSENRHNWITPPWGTAEAHVTVTESWTFAGRAGRASGRTTAIDAGSQTYKQSFIWDELGNLASESYPVCQHATCAGADLVRSQTYSYANGVLTNVPGFGSLTYHPSGLVATVTHTNGVTDIIAGDASGLPRPGSITTTGAVGANWVSGTYTYDGAGNLVKMGSDYFLYDARSRVTLGRVGDAGTEKKQSYGFDRYGNMLSITTQVGTGAPVTRTIATVATTNRLSASAYDTAGNTTSQAGQSYSYDPFHRITVAPGNRVWVYGPGDERLWQLYWPAPPDPFTLSETYFLRGLGNQVLREYRDVGGNAEGKWFIGKDYIYRDGLLLAAVDPPIDRTVHYSLDHLGSPRLVTYEGGATLSLHHYYPFGEEVTNPNQDVERMKFTGHERDLFGTGTTDDLDFMHARWCSPMTGRFLSVDPATPATATLHPQRWNRYSYVVDNPLVFVDRTGREPEAYLLLTGRFYDPTLHSAIYIVDRDPQRQIDRFFSNGGRVALQAPTGSLAQYVSAYDYGKDPTTALRLRLSTVQVENLYRSLQQDFRELSGGVVPPNFDELRNNCTQYSCRKILEATDPDLIDYIVYETIETAATQPVLTSHQAVLLLYLGRLIDIDINNRNYVQQRIVFLSYNPPGK